ncbi:MAG: AmmeMemoRadiSam system protein B [Clostridiales bacterium]|nr:AmmeMemoRadiSam system protein B [Clostridiales bacterium]
MKEDSPIPRLRTDLEVIPTSYRGEKALLVRDHLGLIRDPVILQGDALSLLGLIDGQRTVRDIQVEFVRLKRGMLVDCGHIERIVAELEASFLLQSWQYQKEKERLLEEYVRLEVREASHAGHSYPANPRELSHYLESFFFSGGDDAVPGTPPGRICALIAPHIDFEVGKRVYAKAYRAIRDVSPRRVFLLGTGHSLDEGYFSLTEKDYETPLGRTKTDRDVVNKLKKAGNRAVAPYDISHRREHSLEFQLVFLQHLYGTSFSLVPILCGSFAADVERVSRPSQINDVARFLEEMRACWDENKHDSLFVAGVDFSHIGPKFGHRERAMSLLLEAKQHDHALLEALSRGDVEALWAESRRVRDRYNVCGLGTLASLLEIFPESRGQVLDYEFWREEATASAVSFAAAILTVS